MELVQMPEGYWQIKNMPTVEELEKYYSQEHYQQGQGVYEIKYTPEELQWKKTEQELIVTAIESIGNISRCLDIGCGEGYLMNALYNKNYFVHGVDYSSHGIEKENPHLMNNFQQGNIYNYLVDADLHPYDCISLMNVIEHVNNPQFLLEAIHAKMSEDAILAITFPNDFSAFQALLKSTGKISRDFWVSLPRHLSYFNTESMEKFLTTNGYKVHTKLSDFPIDFALCNDDSNYVEDRSKGKNVHRSRVMLHNFLYDTDKEKYLTILKAYAEMGVGRNLTFICKKA